MNDDKTPSGGWTVTSVKVYLETIIQEVRNCIDLRMIENDKRYEQRFKGSQEALTKAETSLEKRLEGMNEFRAALTEQASRFISRDEYFQAHKTSEKDISLLVSRLDKMEAKGAGLNAGWVYLGGIIMFIGGVIEIISVIYNLSHK